MIHPSEITVVMQGDIRSETISAIRSVRHLLPNSRLILSTFNTEDTASIADEVDDVILSDDPGAMPSFVKTDILLVNNVNRQLTTSKAGLDLVRTAYAVKMRTDCVLHNANCVDLLERFSTSNADPEILLVSSFFTRHPYGLACYLFHVSDWFVCGRSDRVRQFFSAPLMTLDDATWFERHKSLKSSTYAARRFRARFTPEQHITTHFAHTLGYQTPHYLNHWTIGLAEEYEDFLASEVVVASPSQLGFTIGKYIGIEDNIYQRVDCISFSDWAHIVHRRPNKNRLFITENELPPYSKRLVRLLANKFRHPVIRLSLLSRGISAWARSFLFQDSPPRLPHSKSTKDRNAHLNPRK
jgi:WavE lipopolysaccharide synthesis